MTPNNVKDLRRALIDAGFEVFRVRGNEVHLAERQNVQLMEAGVRACLGDPPAVLLVARAQRSDAPAHSDAALFDLVRARASALRDAGYEEVEHQAREIRSVSDAAHVLDVWYEVTFRRAVASLDELIGEVGRALAHERYVVP